MADADEAREIARTLNVDRRQLDREQRREVVAALWQAGHSQRAIARAVGVSEFTVNKDIAGVRHLTPDADVPNRTTGTDGKSYPAVRKHPQKDEVPHTPSRL